MTLPHSEHRKDLHANTETKVVQVIASHHYQTSIDELTHNNAYLAW